MALHEKERPRTRDYSGKERRSTRRKGRARNEKPRRGKLWRTCDWAKIERRGICKLNFKNEGKEGEQGILGRWRAENLRALTFVEPRLHGGAPVLIRAVRCLWCSFSVRSAGEKGEAGDSLQAAMACDQRPESDEQERKKFLRGLHLDQ